MSVTNLSKINLNLLLALEALLIQQNVSKAAEQCYVTQSAMSLSLKQLRDIFQDPLLIRGQASSMQLSNKAMALIEPVRQALQSLDKVFVTTEPLDLKHVKREINIGMTEYLVTLLFPKLFAIAKRQAPGIIFNVKPLQRVESNRVFVKRQIDLAIGFMFEPPQNLHSIPLFEERVACIARPGHPALQLPKPLSLKALGQYPQIIWSLREHYGQTSTGQWYQSQGIRRKVLASVPQPQHALQIVSQTDAITLMIKRAFDCVNTQQSLHAELVEFPAKSVHLFWHEITHNDPVLQWLRQQIKQLAAELT